MISVDTNVLIRAFLADDPKQTPVAQMLLEKCANGKKLFISSYALLEMVWVLKVKKYSRSEICEALLDLLDSPGIVIGQRAVITTAVESFIKGKADFGDYMIMAEGNANGCHKFATFDQALLVDTTLAKEPGDYL